MERGAIWFVQKLRRYALYLTGRIISWYRLHLILNMLRWYSFIFSDCLTECKQSSSNVLRQHCKYNRQDFPFINIWMEANSASSNAISVYLMTLKAFGGRSVVYERVLGLVSDLIINFSMVFVVNLRRHWAFALMR